MIKVQNERSNYIPRDLETRVPADAGPHVVKQAESLEEASIPVIKPTVEIWG
jgi:hypothetical protein